MWRSFTFPFYFYGEPYSSVYVDARGNLGFGTPGTENLFTSLPVSAYDGWTLLPIFSPFHGDFDLTLNGSVSYSTETVATGQRAIVIRYSDVLYQTSVTGSNYTDYLSMDVLLYETPAGQIDVRYYRIDVDETGLVTFQVGMQSDEGLLSPGGEANPGPYGSVTSSLFLPYNLLLINASTQAALQSNTLRFNFTGIVDVGGKPCGGLGYDLSSLSQTDLSYRDNKGGYWLYFRMCGALTQQYCTRSYFGHPSMICQVGWFPNNTYAGYQYELASWNVSNDTTQKQHTSTAA